MSMLRISILGPCLLLLACHSAAVAQEGTAPDPKADLHAAFARSGIEVDLEHKRLTVRAKVSRPADLLEYVLITRVGKAHEALLVTEASPSVLNAALLALGLTPGTNVTYKEKDPPPSEEEVRAGVDWLVITPPTGPQVWFTVAWKDDDAAKHECPLEDLLMDLDTGEGVADAEWIYIGGRMAAPYRGEAPVFIADLEGNLVSSCYLDPGNHLVTLRHARARSDQNWWMTEACPPPGTAVALTVHTQKPDLVRVREERLAKEAAAGKKPKGPPKELPAQPASSDNPPPIKRDDEGERKGGTGKDSKKDGGERGR
ncbi:MAG: YdjY domain-containing protein [Planctomycetota bacterium]